MKQYVLIILLGLITCTTHAQKPCTGGEYRRLDFWVGDWEAYGPKGLKAGDSKISIILDSCIILEEWTSTGVTQGIRYAGKSFNTYNAITRQWQQTWVDNVGGSTEYLQGRFDVNKVIYKTTPFTFKKDTMAIRQLTFFNLGPDKVRQLGEISKDNGATWVIEFDLEYRRRKN